MAKNIYNNPLNTHPANGIVQATVDDSAQYRPTRGFMVDADGTLKVDDEFGVTATLTVAAGVVYPITITRAYSTGTVGPSNITFLY